LQKQLISTSALFRYMHSVGNYSSKGLQGLSKRDQRFQIFKAFFKIESLIVIGRAKH